MTQHRLRFAPSPTGDLHLGHAYSALYSWQKAEQNPEYFQLRIDDLDHTRCRTKFIERQIADLTWLGISWQTTPLYQSQRLARYQSALSFLKEKEYLYPCLLSRKEVAAILSAPQQDTSLRASSDAAMAKRENQDANTPADTSHQEPAWRLDMAKITANPPKLYWFEQTKGQQMVDFDQLHDPVIARRDIGASYDLSVVLDDYDSGITLVTRGADLYEQTGLHRLLQHLLNLPTPLYDHHQLITDEEGRRLAKRDDAKSLASLRQEGASRADILALLPL